MRRAAAVLVAGIFLAGALMGPAAAHTVTFATSVSLSVSDKTPAKGQKVTFTAKVSSPKRACRVNRTVRLLKDGSFFASSTTNSTGVATFTAKIRRNSNWQARVRGKILVDTHLHHHACSPARSNIIRLKVH